MKLLEQYTPEELQNITEEELRLLALQKMIKDGYTIDCGKKPLSPAEYRDNILKTELSKAKLNDTWTLTSFNNGTVCIFENKEDAENAKKALDKASFIRFSNKSIEGDVLTTCVNLSENEFTVSKRNDDAYSYTKVDEILDSVNYSEKYSEIKTQHVKYSKFDANLIAHIKIVKDIISRKLEYIEKTEEYLDMLENVHMPVLGNIDDSLYRMIQDGLLKTNEEADDIKAMYFQREEDKKAAKKAAKANQKVAQVKEEEEEVTNQEVLDLIGV